MRNLIRNVFNLSLICLVLLGTFSSAVEIGELEKYRGKEFGPEYFGPIQGEIYGQAAPGVQAVYVNGRSIVVGKDLYFKTAVSLSQGQKYLTIDTRYQGLRFIKKYLVIRHPKAEKTFKLHVPLKEFQKIIKKEKPLLKKRRIIPPKKIIKKITIRRQPKVEGPGFEFVVELASGRLLVVRRVEGKYFALIYDVLSKHWIPLQEISYPEFRDLLTKGVIPPSFDP